MILTEDQDLHWLDVALENTGSTTLWDYSVRITAEFDRTQNDVQLHSLASMSKEGVHAIDPGETAYEHGTIKVSKEVDFLTFRIEVKNANGTTWDRCITVSNRI
jgi:hypothetical protein